MDYNDQNKDSEVHILRYILKNKKRNKIVYYKVDDYVEVVDIVVKHLDYINYVIYMDYDCIDTI